MDSVPTLDDLRNEAFFDELVKLPFIDAIYIFGSYATRATEVTTQSDIDLLIECPDATAEQWKMIEWVIQNSPCLITIDIHRMDGLKPGKFRDVVMREKSVLFMRNPANHFTVLEQAIERAEERLAILKQYIQRNKEEKNVNELMEVFYETTHQLMRWMRRCALVEGVRTNGYVLTLRYAYQAGWIKDRTAWEQLYRDFEYAGNRPALALLHEIAARIPAHLRLIECAIAQLHSWHQRESALRDTLFARDMYRQKTG